MANSDRQNKLLDVGLVEEPNKMLFFEMTQDEVDRIPKKTTQKQEGTVYIPKIISQKYLSQDYSFLNVGFFYFSSLFFIFFC